MPLLVVAAAGLGSEPAWAKRKRSGNDEDCNDFEPQKQAQRFFKRHQPSDSRNLDGDNDGRAREILL